MKHTVSIKAQLTKEEYAKVKDHVETRGMKLQTWFRDAILLKYVSERQRVNTNIVLAPSLSAETSARATSGAEPADLLHNEWTQGIADTDDNNNQE